MTSQHLFRFGYCTPAQWAANAKHGWDDESSSAFFVESASEDEALEWGREVAEAYVRHLFAQAGSEDSPSWKDADFAHWIEDAPDEVFPVATLASLPRVRVGDLPDFGGWR